MVEGRLAESSWALKKEKDAATLNPSSPAVIQAPQVSQPTFNAPSQTSSFSSNFSGLPTSRQLSTQRMPPGFQPSFDICNYGYGSNAQFSNPPVLLRNVLGGSQRPHTPTLSHGSSSFSSVPSSAVSQGAYDDFSSLRLLNNGLPGYRTSSLGSFIHNTSFQPNRTDSIFGEPDAYGFQPEFQREPLPSFDRDRAPYFGNERDRSVNQLPLNLVGNPSESFYGAFNSLAVASPSFSDNSNLIITSEKEKNDGKVGGEPVSLTQR